jgi:hypothetical protein
MKSLFFIAVCLLCYVMQVKSMIDAGIDIDIALRIINWQIGAILALIMVHQFGEAHKEK